METSSYIPYLDLIIGLGDGQNRLQAISYTGYDVEIPVYEYDLTKQFFDVFTDGEHWFHANARSCETELTSDFRFSVLYTLAKIRYFYENDIPIGFLEKDGLELRDKKIVLNENKLNSNVGNYYASDPNVRRLNSLKGLGIYKTIDFLGNYRTPPAEIFRHCVLSSSSPCASTLLSSS